MIEKLYNCGCFDYKKFILDHLKEFAFSSDESVLMIYILDSKDEEPDFSVETVSKYINITPERFDKALTRLMERGFYEVYISNDENGKVKEAVSLTGFFNRVQDILEGTPEDKENELFQVTQAVQKGFNRILSANELEILSSLVLDDRRTLPEIEGALEYMKGHYKVASMRNLVSSLNKNTEPKKEPKLPDFVKSFVDNIK